MLIAPFVRGDRKKPRFEPFGDIEGVYGDMDLEKRVLEDVLGAFLTSHKTVEESHQIVLISLNKHAKGVDLTLSIGLDKLLVGSIIDESGATIWLLGCGNGAWLL
jgi:hypothetical protein